MQIHREKEQAGQEEIQNLHFKEKRSAGKFNVGAKAVLKEMRRAEILDGIKGTVLSVVDSTQLILHPVKGKGLRKFLYLKKTTAAQRLCKCTSKREPNSISRRPQDLATSAMWFLLQ